MVSESQFCYKVLSNLVPYYPHVPYLTLEQKLTIKLYLSGKVSTTLSPGDYICYRGGSMGRVNGIFIHYLPQNPKRIFLHITPIRTESRVIDGVLGLPMYEINNKCDEIIGLPSITGVKLYMIGVSMVDREGGGKDIRLGGEKLIHCTWDMEFF